MDKRKLIFSIFLILSISLIGTINAGNWTSNLNTNLISYYKLNETSGTTAYDSIGTNNGTANTNYVFNTSLSGIIGTAADFSKSTTANIITNSITTPVSYSVSMWINVSILNAGGNHFWWRGTDWAMNKIDAALGVNETAGTITLRVMRFTSAWATDINSNATGYNNGSWHHVVGVIDNGVGYLYVNGALQNSVAKTKGTLINSSLIFGKEANYYSGGVDEFGYWDRALTSAEVIQLYNGGAGITYEKAVITVNVTNVAPSTNFILDTTIFNSQYLINNTGGLHVFNTTLWVLNSGGGSVIANTTIHNSVGTSITGNITGEIITDGIFTWYFSTYYNNSEGIVTMTNSTVKTFVNAVRFNIVDDSQVIVSGATAYLNGTYYNTNPFYYPAFGLINSTTGTFNISASASGYQTNITVISVNLSSQTIYNVTLTPYRLSLAFYRTNGSAINVSGYITDLNQSIVFSNVSYLKEQADFQNSLIYIRFIKGIYNYSAYLTWENKSQFYEYDNSVPYFVSENITIFNHIDTSSYFQTQDNAGNIIKGAVIRIYGVVPANSTSGTNTYGFFGQRITDDNGRTVFPMDSDMEIYLVVTAKGYQTKTSRLTASEITTFTSSDPFIIRMQKSPYTTQANVFLGGLYKLEGTRVYESRFDNLSSDYYMFIYDVHLRPIKYGTSYEGVNYSVSLDGTTRSGVISLLSGQQFSSISNSTWYLYIWVNNSLAYNISMAYNNIPQEVILDIDLESLADSNAWRIVIFVGIILASMLAGLLFRTGEDDVGLHVFFVGGFLGTLAVNGLGWLALTGGIFYLGKIVKRFFNE